MPSITVSVNNKAEIKAENFDTAIVILGKNRNFIKNEMSKNINIFKTPIFTDGTVFFQNPENTDSAGAPKRIIIIAGDDRARAVETAILCSSAGIKAYILTEKPIHRVCGFTEAVVTVQNAELSECTAAIADTDDGFFGEYDYLCGSGENAVAAAADAISKLPRDVSHLKIFTDAPIDITEKLFSLVSDNFEIFRAEGGSSGFSFSLFVK
jgi:hypothetical protein